MDELSLPQIDKYFFVYKLPERLKDHGRDGLRSQLLTYVNEQLLDGWRKTPRILQDVLQELGRIDLSIKVQELVGKPYNYVLLPTYILHAWIHAKLIYFFATCINHAMLDIEFNMLIMRYLPFAERYPATTVCQETSSVTGGFSPQEESAAQGGGKQPPVQETQRFTQTQLQLRNFTPDELHRDCADKDRSSTEGEGQREVQPQAISPLSHNILQSASRYGSMTRKSSSKSRERPLENILEETSLSQDENRYELMTGSLKRTDSTVSTTSHDSFRSSGYYSNPRASVLRLSQVSNGESIAENEDSVEDEGVVMGTHQMNESRVVNGYESSGTESSSPASSPSRSADEAPALADQDDLPPVPRERCNQMSSTPNHKRWQTKRNCDLSPEHSEMRGRSSSLPNRASYLQAQSVAVAMPSIGLQSPLSHSSSTSLDSETTYGSQSEKSSINGSLQSIASTASGKWLIYPYHIKP